MVGYRLSQSRRVSYRAKRSIHSLILPTQTPRSPLSGPLSSYFNLGSCIVILIRFLVIEKKTPRSGDRNRQCVPSDDEDDDEDEDDGDSSDDEDFKNKRPASSITSKPPPPPQHRKTQLPSDDEGKNLIPC